MANLNDAQQEIARAPLDARIFLSGPAGCGKTTTGVARMNFLLAQGVRADSLLVLAPQRTLHEPYRNALRGPDALPGGEVSLHTIGGLSRRVVDLFWPLAAEAAGFAHPGQPPVFLNLETAQYYMAHIVRPLLEEGFFESVAIDRNRLYSQILDNLNKSAVIGFPVEEIGPRLDAAWLGDPAQRRVYADAQESALRFRQFCYDNNLLDFSLQMHVFWNYLWQEEYVRDYLQRTFDHLIFDNVEEDVPRAHDMIRQWLPGFQSALLIYDEGGGYRRFLGADPETGWALREMCDRRADLQDSFVMSAEMARLEGAFAEAINPTPGAASLGAERVARADVRGDSLAFIQSRFYPELLDAVADETLALLNGGLPPSEIVILAPYLPDSLRFSLTNRLEARNIPWRSHRPSRSLRDEPASHTLLTLAALAHPAWNIRPPKFDVAYALMQTIEGMDLVRAQLLAEIVYRQRDFSLAPFDGIKPDVQERITFTLGNRYGVLRNWLQAYRESEPLPLDHFLRKLFGEVLSQPGFGFHASLDAIRVAASLVESVKRFRIALEPSGEQTGLSGLAALGKEYIAMLNDGVIAAQYLESWRTRDAAAVFVAPAYTFLLANQPVTVQVWLDAGSSGWYERLAQPVTHPFVLARGWEPDRIWTDADEVERSREAMARLVSGLLRRCRERIYLGMSELGESGFEHRGELLKVFQKVLQSGSTDGLG